MSGSDCCRHGRHSPRRVATIARSRYIRPPMPTSAAKPWLFDLWSYFYDEALVQRLVYRPVHDAVLQELGHPAPRSVLDLGCGTGLLATRVRRELGVPRVAGADFSAGMLAQAATGRSDIDWVRATAVELPFSDSSFDAIVSCESFHWFPDQEAALHECFRVLTPGGRLLVAFVNPPMEVVGDIAYAASWVAGQPFRWPTPSRMRELLEQSGFAVESQRRIFRLGGVLLLPPVLSVARRI